MAVVFWLSKGGFGDQESIWRAPEEEVLDWIYLTEVRSLNDRIALLASLSSR